MPALATNLIECAAPFIRAAAPVDAKEAKTISANYLWELYRPQVLAYTRPEHLSERIEQVFYVPLRRARSLDVINKTEVNKWRKIAPFETFKKFQRYNSSTMSTHMPAGADENRSWQLSTYLETALDNSDLAPVRQKWGWGSLTAYRELRHLADYGDQVVGSATGAVIVGSVILRNLDYVQSEVAAAHLFDDTFARTYTYFYKWLATVLIPNE